MNVNRGFMWTDSTTVLQWLNYTARPLLIIANRVCEFLEHSNVGEWNHVASSDNPADAGTRDKSCAVFQSSRWVKGPKFLKTKQLPFEPSTEVVDNLELGVAIKEIDDTNIWFGSSATKSPR